jgi:hypothetical protein
MNCGTAALQHGDGIRSTVMAYLRHCKAHGKTCSMSRMWHFHTVAIVLLRFQLPLGILQINYMRVFPRQRKLPSIT